MLHSRKSSETMSENEIQNLVEQVKQSFNDLVKAENEILSNFQTQKLDLVHLKRLLA